MGSQREGQDMRDADNDRQERRDERRESDPHAVRRKERLLFLRWLIDALLFPEQYEPPPMRSDRRQVRERSFSSKCS